MINLAKIKEKRRAEKITLKKMADALGYGTASGYYRVESGSVKLLAEQVPTVCQILKMEYSDIFFDNQLSISEN